MFQTRRQQTSQNTLLYLSTLASVMAYQLVIVGRKLDEATILNVARAYEKIRDTAFEPF